MNPGCAGIDGFSSTMTMALTTLASATTGSDREIEAADDKHQHLPGGDNNQERGAVQNVLDVVDGQEVRHEQRKNRRWHRKKEWAARPSRHTNL